MRDRGAIMERATHSARAPGRFALALLVAAALMLVISGGPAVAVRNQGATSTTVTPDTAGSTATYEFGRFRTNNREEALGYSVTFPVGTNVSGATSVDPAGSVSVSGQTVTVTFATSMPERSSFYITLGNIINPNAGTYNVGQIAFDGLDRGTPETTYVDTADYTITGGTLSVTITTPDTGQSVDFGNVDPGIPSATETVTVQVNSTGAYTITRTLGGDNAEMGLGITGGASGSKPAGNSTFYDAYQLTPPWTTPPSIPLTATVVYSVVQN